MLKQSPPSAALGRVVRFVLADALLLATSWALVYQLRFGQWPAVSRGPLGLIGVWLFIQYLLGTYTALARYQLDFSRQLRNCSAAAVSVMALALILTGLRGEPWLSTMSRGFLFPVVGLGFLSTQVLRLTQISSHLWKPQEQWLFLVSQRERAVLSSEIEVGGCAIPCGLEWRHPSALAPLPEALPSLLQLDGVAIGSDEQLCEADKQILLRWQESGIRLLTAQAWSEQFLHRLPPALVTPIWAERVQAFAHARTGPSARLKRLGDVFVSGFLLLLVLPLRLLMRPRLYRDRCGGCQGSAFERLRFAGSGRLSALPQLINVWRGEMSLVGPRPLRLDVMQELQQRLPGAELRQWMRPGMTGWGRIAGPPPEEPDEMNWELGRDLYYLRHHSLSMDLRLLWSSLLQMILPWRSFR